MRSTLVHRRKHVIRRVGRGRRSHAVDAQWVLWATSGRNEGGNNSYQHKGWRAIADLETQRKRALEGRVVGCVDSFCGYGRA